MEIRFKAILVMLQYVRLLSFHSAPTATLASTLSVKLTEVEHLYYKWIYLSFQEQRRWNTEQRLTRYTRERLKAADGSVNVKGTVQCEKLMKC